MPVYVVDMTMSDHATADVHDLVPMMLRYGWQHRTTWDAGGQRFYRLVRVFEDVENLDTLLAALFWENQHFGLEPNHPPAVVSMAIRDTSFRIEDSIPPKYRTRQPRRR
jgi:hypothetical protein